MGLINRTASLSLAVGAGKCDAGCRIALNGREGLIAGVEREHAEKQKLRAEEVRADAQAARERLTPLETRLARLLATIPVEMQREGLSLRTASVAAGSCPANSTPGGVTVNTADTETAVTPRFGLLWRPEQWVSLRS